MVSFHRAMGKSSETAIFQWQHSEVHVWNPQKSQHTLVAGLLQKSLRRVSALCLKKVGSTTGQRAENSCHLSHKWNICIPKSQPPSWRWGGKRTRARGQGGLRLTSGFWLPWQDLPIHDLETAVIAYTRCAQDEASHYPSREGTHVPLIVDAFGAGNQLHSNGFPPTSRTNRCIWSTN